MFSILNKSCLVCCLALGLTAVFSGSALTRATAAGSTQTSNPTAAVSSSTTEAGEVMLTVTTYRDGNIYQITSEAKRLRNGDVSLPEVSAPADNVPAAAGDIVFSQIYANGGNSGSAYQNNYLELFNRTNSPINISGWPIYLASATGTFDESVAVSSSQGVFIAAHGYLLFSFGPVSANGAPVPADFAFPFFSPFPGIPGTNLSPSGKVFLTQPGTHIFGSTCPLPNASIIDFVGYGSTATCFEGSGPTATTGVTTAAFRKSGGCTDANNNTNDFSISSPNPRNSGAAANNCANPIDDADFFVRQHYADFFSRQPDADGLAFWTNQITACGSDAACIDLKRANVSAAFFVSIEFQETGYLVYRTYKAAFGNLPNKPIPVLFTELLTDTQQIGQGVVVNSPGWEQQLENNKLAYFSSFVTRTRFTNTYPTSNTPTQFVDALFTNAGVTPSASERTSLINEFGAAANTADTAARARVLRRVAENSALAQLEYNRAFVLMQYFGYLRRNPNDPPETGLNFDGYNFWLNKLNQANGNYISAEMVRSFLISIEYRQRFGP